MVSLYVDGKKVGDLPDPERVTTALAARAGEIELRDAAGTVIARVVPTADPDWVAAITPEETARRMAEPGFSFEEVKKMLGWK